MNEFKLVDEYMLFRLGAKEITKELTIVETERRHKCEISYGFIHMIWIVKFVDGSVIASIPMNTSEKVKSFLIENTGKYDIYDNYFVSHLKDLADIEAKRTFNKESCGSTSSVIFACNADTVTPANQSINTIRITDNAFEYCEDINFPEHCLPDGVIYGVVENNQIVSLAHAHKTGKYEDIVADIGVDTLKNYRRKDMRVNALILLRVIILKKVASQFLLVRLTILRQAILHWQQDTNLMGKVLLLQLALNSTCFNFDVQGVRAFPPYLLNLAQLLQTPLHERQSARGRHRTKRNIQNALTLLAYE